VCHGADMRGGIGPSLLDDEWLHGGSEREVLRTITDGVISKGMISWGPILGPEGVREVAAYVITKNAEALGREPEAGSPEGS
jgi:cytochrome c oxidase cbb3-type subunit 3